MKIRIPITVTVAGKNVDCFDTWFITKRNKLKVEALITNYGCEPRHYRGTYSPLSYIGCFSILRQGIECYNLRELQEASREK